MLKLYRFPGATCAAKVLLALAEKGVAFEDAVISRDDLATDWYRKLNPAGVVPTIIDQGETIVESSVILNYVEDAFNGPVLRPTGALDRAHMNHWLKLADETLPSLGTMSYTLFARQNFLQKSKAELEAYFAAIPDDHKRFTLRSAIEQGLESPLIPGAVATLMRLQMRANDALRDHAFLAGDQYSLAEAAVTPFFVRIEDFGLLATESELPAFHRWWNAVQQRPSFKAAVTDTMPMQIVAGLRAAAQAQKTRLMSLKHQVPLAA